MTTNHQSLPPRNAKPLRCGIGKRSNASTKKYVKDCSGAPLALRQAHRRHAVGPHQSTRVEEKGEAVVVEETTIGIREILRRHPENLNSSTIPNPQSQVMYRGKRNNRPVTKLETTNNLSGSPSAALGARTAVVEAVSDSTEAPDRHNRRKGKCSLIGTGLATTH